MHALAALAASEAPMLWFGGQLEAIGNEMVFFLRALTAGKRAMICFSTLMISYLPDIFKAFHNELIYHTDQQAGSSAI